MRTCKVCYKSIPVRNKWFCSQRCSNKMPTNYWKGKKFSVEYRKKLSQAHKGKMINEKHPLWKGEDAAYRSIHSWVMRHRGQPSLCKKCGTTEAKRFDWANISGTYKRDLDDYVRLCRSCHRKYDKSWIKAWETRRNNVTPVR